MAQTQVENLYHHRRVAETGAKSCFICYKPSSSVLITPDSRDYFYICASHLKDRNFALPDADEVKSLEERRKKEELDREVEAVKREFEEKMRKKREKRRGKSGKSGDEEKKDGKQADKDKKEEEQSDEKDEKEKEEKIKALTEKKTSEGSKDAEGPRIFRLQKYVNTSPAHCTVFSET